MQMYLVIVGKWIVPKHVVSIRVVISGIISVLIQMWKQPAKGTRYNDLENHWGRGRVTYETYFSVRKHGKSRLWQASLLQLAV